MKKASVIAASIAGGAVLIGGGAWAATSLPSSTTETASATPAPTVTSTPTVVPTVNPTSTPAPTFEPTPTASAAPEYTETQSAYIAEANRLLNAWDVYLSDAELLEAGQIACERVGAGEHPDEAVALEDAEYYVNYDLVHAAVDELC